jgi:hypothetical protein
MVDEKQNGTENLDPAQNATTSSSPAETAVAGTVARSANKPPTESDKPQQPASDRYVVTSASTKRNKRPSGGVVKQCEYCGNDYLAKRPKRSRFCSPYCRRENWLLCNPHKAAEIQAAEIERLRHHIEAKGGVWKIGAKPNESKNNPSPILDRSPGHPGPGPNERDSGHRTAGKHNHQRSK